MGGQGRPAGQGSLTQGGGTEGWARGYKVGGHGEKEERRRDYRGKEAGRGLVGIERQEGGERSRQESQGALVRNLREEEQIARGMDENLEEKGSVGENSPATRFHRFLGRTLTDYRGTAASEARCLWRKGDRGPWIHQNMYP